LKLLITGASGLYGSKLAELSQKNGHKVYAGYSKNKVYYGNPVQFDIAEKSQVDAVFKQVSPEVVVHAATLTDVDKCETSKELAWKINVEGTRNVAEAAKASKAFLIYISTDYVFNGEKGHYKETDKPNPVNYYGHTKLKAEELVQAIAKKYCIARTCVIYGASPASGKTNFALWLIGKLKNKEQTKIVTDQWISPTLNTSLAEMTLETIERKLTGIYHLAGATRLSRLELATQIAQTFNLETKTIQPVASSQMTWTAKRPKDSSLDTSKAQQTLKTKPIQIKEALQRLKAEMEKPS